MSFGSLLARTRKARGLRGAELSAAVGVASTTISQWENEHRRPDTDQLRELCRVLHVSADVLLERVPFQLGPMPEETGANEHGVLEGGARVKLPLPK